MTVFVKPAAVIMTVLAFVIAVACALPVTAQDCAQQARSLEDNVWSYADTDTRARGDVAALVRVVKKIEERGRFAALASALSNSDAAESRQLGGWREIRDTSFRPFNAGTDLVEASERLLRCLATWNK